MLYYTGQILPTAASMWLLIESDWCDGIQTDGADSR